MQAWAAYLAIGAAVGFLAGLLGIGGGMVMVPLLALLFTARGFAPEHVMHLALATAMASVIFTSIASVAAHHRHGAVHWPIARAMAPGMAAGALGAALGAGLVPTRPLAAAFTMFLFLAAARMMFESGPEAARPLPGRARLAAAGAAIGALSSLLAAGGAFLSIPYLARRGVPLRGAIGTAAASGFPIALAGTAGYVLQGLRVEGLPAGALGYVYLPALALVVAASMPAAPLGARLAHRLPVRPLRILFALVLLALALRMLVRLWSL
jgi:uncharacterized membrane protein YfcA